MELKFWIFTGLLLTFSIGTTNSFFLKSPIENTSFISTQTASDLTNDTININDSKINSTDTSESNINDSITKVEPTTSTEVLEAVQNILDIVHNNNKSSSKTAIDKTVENNDIQKDELNYGITTTMVPLTTINTEEFIDNILQHHVEPLESSNLVRNLDETVHNLEDTNSKIEIQELTTGGDALEANIRKSVNEEISLDAAFETSALEALEDIPEPEVRKALAEDLLDGLNQKNRNDEKIDDNNMARNVYVDEKSENKEVSSTEAAPILTTTEHLAATTSEQVEEELNAKLLEIISELPNLKMQGTTVSIFQDEENIEKKELESHPNLRLNNIDDLLTTETIKHTKIVDESTTAVPINIETTTIPIQSNENIVDIEQNSSLSVKNTSLSGQELNVNKNRSGRTFTKDEILSKSENIINDKIIEKVNAKNSNKKEDNIKIDKIINLKEIINTTPITNVGTNLEGKPDVDKTKFEDNLTKNDETILSEATTVKIEENVHTQHIENEFKNENLIDGKNVQEDLVENDKIEENISLNSILQPNFEEGTAKFDNELSSEELSSEDKNINKIKSIFVQINSEDTHKKNVTLEKNASSFLKPNSNSIEEDTDDTKNDQMFVQADVTTEYTTTNIVENLTENSEVIGKIDDEVIANTELEKNPVIEDNINSIQKFQNNEKLNEEVTVDHVENILNTEKNIETQQDNHHADISTTQIPPITVIPTTTEISKSNTDMTKTLTEDVMEIENRGGENIDRQSVTKKLKSNSSSESSESSENNVQTTSSTESSSSEESTQAYKNSEIFSDITTQTNNLISKIDEVNTTHTQEVNKSSSEESSEEDKGKKPKDPKLNIYDILSGNINLHSDNNNLLEKNLNIGAQGRSLNVPELNNKTIYINTDVMPRVQLNNNIELNNLNRKATSDGLKIFIQSDETEKMPSLIFETTTTLPLKVFNNSPIPQSFDKQRNIQSEEILIELENDTTALTETLIEAAELTTELSRHISSFRTIIEADTQIPNETHETITVPSSDPMAAPNIGKALPNHGLKSDITQNNASVLVIICTTTAIMIIGLLAVTFYRYRGKHGTLDIQLEEQRRGKDNNDDDDDDSETMSSLNGSGTCSVTQSLQSNEKDNITIPSNQLSLLSKSHE